jgi:hypothetical protein
MQKVFEPETKALADGSAPRLLVIDGHNSHTSAAFLDYAEAHNIIVICLPPHTTHRLQPCDVSLFGPLASAWRKQVRRTFEEGRPVTRYNLIELYAIAREVAFKASTIQTAFRLTGIWPPNRDALPPDAYLPAEATTTKMSLPFIPELMQPPTIPLDMQPLDVAPVSLPSSPGSLPQPTRSDPDPPIDPALITQVYEPSNLLHEKDGNGQNNTDSVVQEGPTNLGILSAKDINVPDAMKASALPKLPPTSADRAVLWAALADMRDVAGCMAKFIDTSVATTKLCMSENERLRSLAYAKENKPARDHFLPPGQCRVLTWEDQRNVIRGKEDAQKKAAADKIERAAERERKREEKAKEQAEKKRKKAEKAKVQLVKQQKGRGKGKRGRKAKSLWSDDDESAEEVDIFDIWEDNEDDEDDKPNAEQEGQSARMEVTVPIEQCQRRSMRHQNPGHSEEGASTTDASGLQAHAPTCPGVSRQTRSAKRTPATRTTNTIGKSLVPADIDSPATSIDQGQGPQDNQGASLQREHVPQPPRRSTRRFRPPKEQPEAGTVDEDEFFIVRRAM